MSDFWTAFWLLFLMFFVVRFLVAARVYVKASKPYDREFQVSISVVFAVVNFLVLLGCAFVMVNAI